jgi:hypothetical protein
MSPDSLVVLAHVGHWLEWILFLPPFAIVAVAIGRSLAARRARKEIP